MKAIKGVGKEYDLFLVPNLRLRYLLLDKAVVIMITTSVKSSRNKFKQ